MAHIQWNGLVSNMSEPGDSDMNVANAVNLGTSSATPEQLLKVRKTVGCMKWAANAVLNSMRHNDRATFAAACSDARILLVETEITNEVDKPLQIPVRKGTAASFNATLNAPEVTVCTADWGPTLEDTKNLLSPHMCMFLTFLGPLFSKPLIDFVYAFAKDYRAFGLAWIDCPVKTDNMQLAEVKKRTQANIDNPTITSPGAAIVHLATQCEDVLLNTMYSIFYGWRARNFDPLDLLEAALPAANVSAIFATAATQYENCVAPVINQVQSTLPTAPSWPICTPNFIDEPNPNWFRTAEYAFKEITFPTKSLVRGTVMSELTWHKYQMGILHARRGCMNLSEKQVIQHIMKGFARSDQHFTVAQDTSLRPDCTVRQWLEAIRDFYFTGGQFRMNIEIGWKNLDVGTITDYNTLIHKIREYYRLVFEDYKHMRGQMTQLDFAWTLFAKLQQLLSTTASSMLSATLRMYFPASILINNMKSTLKPAIKECTELQEVAAVKFISWCIEELQQVRETANITQMYSTTEQSTDFDYAMLGHKQPAAQHNRLQAAVSQQGNQNNYRRQPRGQGNANFSPMMQSNQTTPPPPPPPAPTPSTMAPIVRGTIPPNLKDLAYGNDESILRNMLQGFTTNTAYHEGLRKRLSLELAGGPHSVVFLLSRAHSQLPHHVKPNFMCIVQLIIRSHYKYKIQQCWFCPDGRRNGCPAHCNHPWIECESLKAVTHQSDRDNFFANPFNATAELTPYSTTIEERTRQNAAVLAQGNQQQAVASQQQKGNNSKRQRYVPSPGRQQKFQRRTEHPTQHQNSPNIR